MYFMFNAPCFSHFIISYSLFYKNNALSSASGFTYIYYSYLQALCWFMLQEEVDNRHRSGVRLISSNPNPNL